MKTTGAQVDIKDRKGRCVATLAVCLKEVIYPPNTNKSSYNLRLSFPNMSGGILLSVDEANKLASEILKATRNLPKK